MSLVMRPPLSQERLEWRPDGRLELTLKNVWKGGHTPGHVDGGGDDGARTWTKEEVWQFFSQFQ